MAAEPIGLIAGQGDLPLLVARGMSAAGRPVRAIGLRDQYRPELVPLCDRLEEAGILQIGRWIRLARRMGVREAVMVGRVSKARMHDPWRLVRQLPDFRAALIWYRRLRHDHRSAAILAAVADELAASGVTLIDSTTFIRDQLASAGTLGKVEPSALARGDIEFGWPLLTGVLGLDVGQAIAVRDRDVIAVEAVEGTDRMIDRTGELCPARGWTLLKSCRPDHDMRADVPTIGVATVERAARAGARCLALGAGRVILVDRPAVLAAADRLGVAIVGV
jgi:DUF1009 family protein